MNLLLKREAVSKGNCKDDWRSGRKCYADDVKAFVDGWTKYTDKQGFCVWNKACNYGMILLSKRWRKYHYILIFYIPCACLLIQKTCICAGLCTSETLWDGLFIPFSKIGRVVAKSKCSHVCVKARFRSMLSVELTHRIILHSVYFYICLHNNEL